MDNDIAEVRTTVFGENANIVGATVRGVHDHPHWAGHAKRREADRRLMLFPLIALVGTGMAKTGSRTAVLLVATGILVLLFQPNR